jgi:hypothetical protein
MQQGKQRNSEECEQFDTLLNEYEYANVTKRSVHSVRRDRLLGRGCPYIKLIGSIRYRRQDISQFIAQNVQKTPGQ